MRCDAITDHMCAAGRYRLFNSVQRGSVIFVAHSVAGWIDGYVVDSRVRGYVSAFPFQVTNIDLPKRVQ